MIPTGDNATGMVGNAPPDRAQLTLEDHLNAVLDYLRSGLSNGTLQPDDMMSLRAFEEAKVQLLQEAMGAQGGEGDQPAPTPQDMNGEEQDYAQGPDDTQQAPGYAGQ
jgi:hypothetical protein